MLLRAVLLASLISLPVLAAPTAAPITAASPDAAATAFAATLRDTAARGNSGYTLLESLTTEVGQRLAGTEAEARGRDWAVAKMQALGFANVRVDSFKVPVWVR
ncbi:MAG: peptidase M28 family protein, partial [Polymorphobacter sp.]